MEVAGVGAGDRGLELDVVVEDEVADVLRGAGNREQLRIEVCDTGIGIDPARLPALFAPFSQADATTTRRYGGTGLGLCISKQLVELMGGRIGAYSVPGEGSARMLPHRPRPSSTGGSPMRSRGRARR